MKKILVIEDEKDLADIVAFNLEKDGYLPVIAVDGMTGLEMARTTPPDLILLDVMLPGMTGIDLLKFLKSSDRTSSIPIILVTAKGEEIDRVVGLEIGADDYVVKPFSMRELLLRVKAILRRGGDSGEEAKFLQVGQITIDQDRHLVSVAGEEIALTTTEYKLLLTFAQRVGRVQSRDHLLKYAWGINYAGETRTVDTHVTRLRTKLGAAGDSIKTIRGFGYKMEES